MRVVCAAAAVLKGTVVINVWGSLSGVSAYVTKSLHLGASQYNQCPLLDSALVNQQRPMREKNTLLHLSGSLCTAKLKCPKGGMHGILHQRQVSF